MLAEHGIPVLGRYVTVREDNWRSLNFAVVWDDLTQTEQHHELKSGLESIKGAACAIIIS